MTAKVARGEVWIVDLGMVAKIHLDEILRSLEALEFDNEGYFLVLLGHVQEHLNLAWGQS